MKGAREVDRWNEEVADGAVEHEAFAIRDPSTYFPQKVAKRPDRNTEKSERESEFG